MTDKRIEGVINAQLKRVFNWGQTQPKLKPSECDFTTFRNKISQLFPQPSTDEALREAIARYISGFKDWDGARQYIKDGWLYKADPILTLLQQRVEESKEQALERIEAKMHRATTGHVLREYRWIFEDDWQALQ